MFPPFDCGTLGLQLLWRHRPAGSATDLTTLSSSFSGPILPSPPLANTKSRALVISFAFSFREVLPIPPIEISMPPPGAGRPAEFAGPVRHVSSPIEDFFF